MFMLIDATFFAAAMHKIADGGWFPLVLGAVVFVVMVTWRRGRAMLHAELAATSVPLVPFVKSQLAPSPQRVPGTAVFLTASRELTPHALLHSLKHYKVLHERVVFLTVEFREVPLLPLDERVACERMTQDCWRVLVRYGFMDRPDIMEALALCGAHGVEFDLMDTSFFLRREKIVPVKRATGMALRRDRLFAFMARNAGSITDYFNIPANRVVELGTRVEIYPIKTYRRLDWERTLRRSC